MAKNGGAPGGVASMSNLSSARQNSFFNSKGSFKKLDGAGGNGASSSRKVDYRQIDFGYKNKEVPNIPGIVQLENNKIDMATFLNDNEDLINIENDTDKLPKSARIAAKNSKTGRQFNLDLDKVKLSESAEPAKSSTRGVIEAFHNSSLS